MIKKRANQQTVVSIQEAFQAFQRDNKIKGLSDASIHYYDNSNIFFFKFLEDNSIKTITEITQYVMEDFVLFLRQTHENSVTINTYLRGTRRFLYWCMSKQYIDSYKIHLIKQEEKFVETYSDEDIIKLLKKPNLKKCCFTEYRSWVMVNYFLETGNRAGSVSEIKVCDVDFEQRYVILRHTKNKTQQVVPLTKNLLEILPTLSQSPWKLEVTAPGIVW